jgi:hypothetical protein
MEKMIKKIAACVLMICIATLIIVSCKKSSVPLPPPAVGGGNTGNNSYPLPDTTIPAPGLKVRWVLNAGAETVANDTFKIVNRATGKMLNVFSDIDGHLVTQFAENGSDNHKWILSSNANGSYTVTNQFSNKVLKAKDCTTANDLLQQSNSTGSACEQWQFVSLGNGYYRITNQSSGNSLGVATTALHDSAQIVLSTYGGGENQEWQLREIPNATIQNAYNLITAAMNLAVARYNKWGNFNKLITVNYVPSVPTADANYNGNMRFGANTIYMREGTALHELAHCMGVGTSPRWNAPLVVSNSFVGTKTLQWIKYYDGLNGIVNTDTQHFWPYGLNQANEYNAIAFDRHVRLVWAMLQDGL